MEIEDEILIRDYLSEFEKRLVSVSRMIETGCAEVMINGKLERLRISESFREHFSCEAVELLNYIIRCRITLIKIQHCEDDTAGVSI